MFEIWFMSRWRNNKTVFSINIDSRKKIFNATNWFTKRKNAVFSTKIKNIRFFRSLTAETCFSAIRLKIMRLLISYNAIVWRIEFFCFTIINVFSIFFDLDRIFRNLKKKLFNIETKLIDNDNDKRFEIFFFEFSMQSNCKNSLIVLLIFFWSNQYWFWKTVSWFQNILFVWIFDIFWFFYVVE